MQKFSDSKHLRLASKHLCLCWTLLASLLQDCSREWVERTCSWDKRYQRIELGLTDWFCSTMQDMQGTQHTQHVPLAACLGRFCMASEASSDASKWWRLFAKWPSSPETLGLSWSPRCLQDVSRCLQYFTASTLTTRTDSSKWVPPFADSGYTLFCCSHQTEPVPAAGFTYS